MAARAGTHQAEHLVTPSMCGPNSLLVGRMGDWTWQLVSDACEIDVLTARDGNGAPTYLSFCYYRILGSPCFHLFSPGFGDRLRVRSAAYGLTSESVVVLHEVRRTAGDPSGPLDPADFGAAPDPGRLHVTHYNRWVTRGTSGSNQGLVRSSPPGFRHDLLPPLPPQLSPRVPYRRAVSAGTPRPQPLSVVGRLRQLVTVDVTRDLNGAGLLYFASYFSVVDQGLYGLWRHLGRDAAGFLDRVVVDQQMCILGNADAGTVLALDVRWAPPVGGVLPVDVTVTDAATGRTVAVCALDVLEPDR